MVAKLLALVLPLGLDTFAVAAALGAAGIARGQRCRVTVLFAAFEGAMPLVGLALGAPAGRLAGGAADYVAVGVLLAFALYTLVDGEEQEEARLADLAEAHGMSLLVLGLSISLDELAIGFTLGLLGLPVVLVLALIVGQAVVLTQVGLRLGARISEGRRAGAERLAGAALAVLALVLLAEKLLA
jgi:putative Mn2+ efflux pump MntP